jgi:phosphinothricin acetyltransferase
MIRHVTENDIDQILAFWNHEIRETLITFNSAEKSYADMQSLLRQKRAENQPFLVAEQNDEIIGFATYGQFRGGIGYRHTAEHTVVLAPNARGKGTGRQLMSAIEEHAKMQGFHSMWAGVSGGNPDAVTFHKRVGYVEGALLPEVGFKFGRWLDLILMQKHL